MADKWRSWATQRIIQLPQSSPDSEVHMDKNLSHQDTKLKTKGAKKTFFVPSSTALRLCMKPLLASLLVLSSLPVLAQKNSARFDPDGAFWILGDTPNDFSEFGAINLNAKRSRRLPVQINGTEIRKIVWRIAEDPEGS